MTRGGLVAVLLTCSTLLLVYVLTLAPTLTWAHHGADGGDLVTAVAQGSIPHPPGFPTYLSVGELFIRLPVRNPAWRLNVMSAVFGAGACALTVVGVMRLLERPASSLIGLTTGVMLGLAPLLWSQALITEVYTLAAFFSALVIYLVLSEAPPWVVGLAWGVGLGAHLLLVFLAPVVVWRAWREEDGARRGEGGGPSVGMAVQRLMKIGPAALVGWAAMYGPVLLVRQGARSPWADVSTFDGWWGLVSGRLYREYVFALPVAAWPRRVLAWAGLLVRQVTPVGALLVGAGWLALWRERRGLAGASLVSFGAFSLYAVGYDTSDSLVYLVPALPLAALWLGKGLHRAVGRLGVFLEQRGWGRARELSTALLLLIPLVQGLAFWKGMDVSDDGTVMTWAERVLEEAPPNAALLSRSDAHTFTLWYAQDVLGQRSDVAVLDRDLWYHDPYREMMVASLGLADPDAPVSAEDAARRAGRPVVEVTQ